MFDVKKILSIQSMEVLRLSKSEGRDSVAGWETSRERTVYAALSVIREGS